MFPVAANGSLPVLLPRVSQFFDENLADFETAAPLVVPNKKYRQSRMLPRTNVTRMTDSLFKKFQSLSESGVVLNIGSGAATSGIRNNWINLDIYPHANCDVAGDAHWLPFRDESIDAVHSRSVFEHLAQPVRAAREVARILRPGGIMICDVPFAYPLHGSPHDFFRYTPDGLKSLFSGLDTIEVAPSLGPCATISLFSERITDALLPGRAGFPLRWVTAWLMQPMKYLDPWIVRKNPGAATAFTILMQKSGGPRHSKD